MLALETRRLKLQEHTHKGLESQISKQHPRRPTVGGLLEKVNPARMSTYKHLY